MAFREVGMFEVKEILRLYLEKGVGKKPTSRTVGVDVKTVRRYVEAAEELGIGPPIDDLKLAQIFAHLHASEAREKGKAYWDCQAKRAVIKKWLDKKVRLTKVRKLLKRVHKVDVPYSTLHRFAVAELGFGRRGKKSVRLVDAVPGQELQIDTGWVVTLTIGGREIRKKAFIFTPNVSRYRFVYPIESETPRAAIEACEAAWEFYGGIFAVLLPDNTKAIIKEASATSPKVNDLFLEYAQTRDITVDPARVGKPQDKARVEKTVSFVRDDCFGGEVLGSIAASRVRALFWCEHEAGLKPHGTTKRRPKEHFEAEERTHLSPAPTETYDIPSWATVTVDKTQHVAAFGALYMLPETMRHETLRARADEKLVRFYNRNVLVKILPRVARGQRSFDKEDIPEEKRAYALRDESILAEQARSYSEAIGDFADRLLEGPAPWTRMRQVSSLLNMVRRFGSDRVEQTCRRALAAEMHQIDRLRRMLEQAADNDSDDETKRVARIIPIARYLRPASTWAIDKKDGEPR